MERYWAKSQKEVISEFKSSENGLSSADARARLSVYGKNKIKSSDKLSIIKIFLRQFKSVLLYILFGAALVSGVFGHWLDFWMIMIIIGINSTLGFFQEYKAEKSINALKKMLVPEIIVIRDGKKTKIRSEDAVPGDVLVLREGDRITADVRVIESDGLLVDESSLTGESAPVAKIIGRLDEKTLLADRKNMAYSGTRVVGGSGIGIIVATGMNTEYGNIARLVTKEKEISPLIKSLNILGKRIGLVTLLVCLIVVLVGVLSNFGLIETLLVGISLAVAAVPEGLPAVITISLAFALNSMIKNNVLIRKLPAAETLGRATVICADKTGTITGEEMTVRRCYFNKKTYELTGNGFNPNGEVRLNDRKVSGREIEQLLKIGVLCNDSVLTDSSYIGDPTEAALLVSGLKGGFSEEHFNEKRVKTFQFSSERKIMAVVRNGVSYVKGAPEVVLKNCKYELVNNKVVLLNEGRADEIARASEKFASEGLRVLGFAYKRVKGLSQREAENELIFCGLQGMIDPPRKGVKEAIKTCYGAGIDVKMLTGDQLLTAKEIAREIGLKGKCISGRELEAMSQSELVAKIDSISIFARISPKDKLRIIDALKKRGEIVAMTGDGINDAPALKKADIGIAMGIKGTEVSKEASDMILVDDNFSSIVKGIEKGRVVYDNIQKFINYLLSCNIAEVAVVFILSLFGVLALGPIHILWINLVTDGLPAIALGRDAGAKDIMKRKPYRGEILSKSLAVRVGAVSFVIGVLLIFVYFLGLNNFGAGIASTMLFTGFILFELVRVVGVRRDEKLGLFSNKWLVLALIVSLVLQLAVLYTPLKELFGVVELGLVQWLILLGAASIGFGLMGLINYLLRRVES